MPLQPSQIHGQIHGKIYLKKKKNSFRLTYQLVNVSRLVTSSTEHKAGTKITFAGKEICHINNLGAFDDPRSVLLGNKVLMDRIHASENMAKTRYFKSLQTETDFTGM